MRGCLAWCDGGLKPPELVQRATEAYRDENDMIAEFIAAEATLNPETWTSTADLYTRFTTWWTTTHASHERVLDRRVFGRLLGERDDLHEKKSGGDRGWRGITLRPPEF